MLKEHKILNLTTNLLVPYIVFYALYIQINGESSPGGGFQAGAIIASAIIALDMIFGNDHLNILMQESYLLKISAIGLFIYAATGVTCMVFGANYLNYYALPVNIKISQNLGISIIEIGVGICVASTLILIYYQFSNKIY